MQPCTTSSVRNPAWSVCWGCMRIIAEIEDDMPGEPPSPYSRGWTGRRSYHTLPHRCLLGGGVKHRTLNWAKAATRTWRQWRAPAALAALALLFACLKGRSPTDGNANDVRLSINAQVVTTAASQLHISIFYLDQGPTQVVLVDKTISTASGTTRLPLTIDLSR